MNPIKIINSAAKYIENEDDLEKFLREIEFDINDLYPDEFVEIVNTCNNKILSNYIIDNVKLANLIDYVKDIEYDNIDTSVVNKISSKVREFAEDAKDVDIIENILFKSGVVEWEDKNFINKFLKGDIPIYLSVFPTFITYGLGFDEEECKVKSLLDETTIMALLKIYCKNNNGYMTSWRNQAGKGFALSLFAIGNEQIICSEYTTGDYCPNDIIGWIIQSKDNCSDITTQYNYSLNAEKFKNILSEYGYSLNPEKFKEQTTNFWHDTNYLKMVGALVLCEDSDVWNKL